MKKRTSNISFINFFDKRIKILEEFQRHGTARNYKSAKTSLNSFLNGRDISLLEINHHIIEEYSLWLQNRHILKNTISFYMRILRAVYNRAVKEGLVAQSNPFRDVYTGVDKTRKRFINPDVVKRLIALQIQDRKLSLARDLFIFGIFTRGMSFVDIAFLKKENIKGSEISYIRSKTHHKMTVRIEKETYAILQNYISAKPSSKYIFPIIDDSLEMSPYSQYEKALCSYNYRLRKLRNILKLDTPLTSYTVRHTWASIASRMNIPLAVISQGMGHTSQRTTEIYLAELESGQIDLANKQIIEFLT